MIRLYFVKFLRLEQDKRSKNWFDLFDRCAGKNVIFTFKQIFSITPLHLKIPRFKWLQSDPTGGSILISIESPALIQLFEKSTTFISEFLTLWSLLYFFFKWDLK